MNLLLVIAFGLAISAAAHQHNLQGQDSVPGCSIRDPLMDPTHEVLHGQDTVWQIPPNPDTILFMAHGVGGSPFLFFDQSPKCEQCYGMPEERSIVLDALRRGYAVISIKSIGLSWDWQHPESCEDMPIVVSILNDWRREHSLEGLPFLAFGISAGGFFATILALSTPTRALILMCSEGLTEMVEKATPETFPPTFFVYMGFHNAEVVSQKGSGSQLSRQMTTAADVEKSIAILIERGVTVERKHIWPHPVTPLFFTVRIPCMNRETSKQMQRAYKAEGWLNGNDYLMANPYHLDWKAPLRKRNALPAMWDANPDKPCYLDPICYELGRAYGLHAATADANDEMFSWLDSIVMSSDNELFSMTDSRLSIAN